MGRDDWRKINLTRVILLCTQKLYTFLVRQSVMDDSLKKQILFVARNTIARLFDTSLPILTLDKKDFSEKLGCFVTIHKDNELRGCIGYITTEEALYDSLPKLAVAAAKHDPRFPPVTKKEFDEGVQIEVSILSIPRRIGDSNHEKQASFIGGETGLIVQRGWKSGVLLPQVFDKNTYPDEALAMTCDKAELKADAWKEKETSVFTFTANIFQE